MGVVIKEDLDAVTGFDSDCARPSIRTFVLGYQADGAREVAEFAMPATADQISLGWHQEQALSLARRLGYRSCVAFDELDPDGPHRFVRNVRPKIRRSFVGIADSGVEVLIRPLLDQIHLELETEPEISPGGRFATMRG